MRFSSGLLTVPRSVEPSSMVKDKLSGVLLKRATAQSVCISSGHYRGPVIHACPRASGPAPTVSRIGGSDPWGKGLGKGCDHLCGRQGVGKLSDEPSGYRYLPFVASTFADCKTPLLGPDQTHKSHPVIQE